MGNVIMMVEQVVEQLGKVGVLSATHFRGDAEDLWAELAPRLIRRWHYVAVSWKCPPSPFFKLNTDVSVVQGRASGGGILRDSSGRLVFAFYKEFGEKEVLNCREFGTASWSSIVS